MNSRVRLLALLASLSLVGLATGCPGPATLAIRPYPPPAAADILAQVRHAHDRVLGLRGRAKGDFSDGGGGRVKIDIGLVMAKPDRLRLSAENTFTGPLLTLATDGDVYQLLDVRRNTFMAGRVNPCSMSRLLRVALHPREVVEVLLGGVPLFGESDVADIQLLWSGKDGGREVLTLRDSRGRVEILQLAPRLFGSPAQLGGWDIREASGQDLGGRVVWKIRHENYAEVPLGGDGEAKPGTPTVRLPSTTYIEDPPHKSDVKLRWRERELNPDMPSGLFHLDPPPGVPTEPDLCAFADPPPPPSLGGPGEGSAAPAQAPSP